MICYRAVRVMAILAINVVLAACPSARTSPEIEPEPTAEVQAAPETKTEIKSEAKAEKKADTKAEAKPETKPKTFPVVMNGLWDFIVLFRGEPFIGTFQFSSSSPGTVGRLTLLGHLDGTVTIMSVDAGNGSVRFDVTTPRGTATFQGRFESNTILAGRLEELKVGNPDASVPLRLLEETAILSATRRE